MEPSYVTLFLTSRLFQLCASLLAGRKCREPHRRWTRAQGSHPKPSSPKRVAQGRERAIPATQSSHAKVPSLIPLQVWSCEAPSQPLSDFPSAPKKEGDESLLHPDRVSRPLLQTVCLHFCPCPHMFPDQPPPPPPLWLSLPHLSRPRCPPPSFPGPGSPLF